MVHLHRCRRAAALPGGTATLLGCQGVDHPQGHRGGPVGPQVGDGVQQGHVGASDQGVAHLRVEGHARHIHAVQRHLVEQRTHHTANSI